MKQVMKPVYETTNGQTFTEHDKAVRCELLEFFFANKIVAMNDEERTLIDLIVMCLSTEQGISFMKEIANPPPVTATR